MEDDENSPLLSQSRGTSNQRAQAKWYHYVGDFFNTIKAFIGTNYLALPYAFAQSGLIAGVVGVLIIATLTDHCCQMLIRCKYLIIDDKCEEALVKHGLTDREVRTLRERLERTLGYGDVGRISLGPWCHTLTQVMVAFTQYTTCIAYVIFMGNAIFKLFPLPPAEVVINGTAAHYSWNMLAEGVPMLRIDSHLVTMHNPSSLIGPVTWAPSRNIHRRGLHFESGSNISPHRESLQNMQSGSTHDSLYHELSSKLGNASHTASKNVAVESQLRQDVMKDNIGLNISSTMISVQPGNTTVTTTTTKKKKVPTATLR